MGRKEKAAKFEANTTASASAAAADKDNCVAEDMNDDDEHNNQSIHHAMPKLGKRRNVTTRRQSARLRCLTSSFSNQCAVTREPINVEEIEEDEEFHVEDLNNSEPIVDQPNSEEEPNLEEVLNRLEPIVSLPNVEGLNSGPTSSQQMNYEEKINYLMQSVEELKSRESIRLSVDQRRSPNLNYRSLYMKSQKMVNDLVEEKLELATKLDRANAKVEAYSEIWEKFVKR